MKITYCCQATYTISSLIEMIIAKHNLKGMLLFAVGALALLVDSLLLLKGYDMNRISLMKFEF